MMDKVLAGMELDLRTVFILFELEGMTTPEIAALAEIPSARGLPASACTRGLSRERRFAADPSPEGGGRMNELKPSSPIGPPISSARCCARP